MTAHRRTTKAPKRPDAVRPIEVAVLDRQGVIVAVNAPWTDFCEANDGDQARCGVGVDYLEVCRRAGDEPGAREVADAITAALEGGPPTSDRIHIACHAPTEERWFDVLISSRSDEAGEITGATVMVTQLPERRAADHEIDRAAAVPVVGGTECDRLIGRCIDGASDAIFVIDENSLRILYANDGAVSMFGHARSEFVETMSLSDLTPDVSIARLTDLLRALRASPGEPIRFWTRSETKDESALEVEIQLDWPPPGDVGDPRPFVAVIRNLCSAEFQFAEE